MNNLHRQLAPISAAAWADLEEEATRTVKSYLAGRRVVDLSGPEGAAFAAVGTGHLADIAAPVEGATARLHEVKPLVELRVPFTVSRQAVDDVERGALDADWQPVKDAAKQVAFAEDRVIFDGYAAAGIRGIRESSSHRALSLPADAREYPDAVTSALADLRLAGVDGPYALVLGVDAYTAVTETVDHGYPVRSHLARFLDGEIVWAPAIDGALLLSTRGGDFGLCVGQDLSIGYLSHDESSVRLYFQETLTFQVHTAEAAVALGSTGSAASAN